MKAKHPRKCSSTSYNTFDTNSKQECTRIFEKNAFRNRSGLLFSGRRAPNSVLQIGVPTRYSQALHRSIAFNHRWTWKIPASDRIMQPCTTAKKPPNIDGRSLATMRHRQLKNLTKSKPNNHSRQSGASDESRRLHRRCNGTATVESKNFLLRINGHLAATRSNDQHRCDRRHMGSGCATPLKLTSTRNVANE